MSAVKFEDTKVWKLARKLRQEIASALRKSRRRRPPEFEDQIYRSALSVMSNIAEGWEAGGAGEKAQFFTYARRSCGEVRSLLYTGLDDGALTLEQFDRLMDRCMNTIRAIAGLIRTVRGWKPSLNSR